MDTAEQVRLIKELLKGLDDLQESYRDLFRRIQVRDGDLVYRFYHHSFKVYYLQEYTQQIDAALRAALPDRALNDWYVQIVDEGTGHTWEQAHNDRWLDLARKIVEGYFHARYFLDCAVEYAGQYEELPQPMPSGLAALLELYRLR